jgi:aldehyde:ferredoxin oxidoreductase
MTRQVQDGRRLRMDDVRRVLVIDLTTASSQVKLFDAAGTLGLGGKVLGIRLLEKYLDLAADPLAPGNVIVITPSLLSAHGMYGSNRFGAFSKSPLTGVWLECYCGGTFGRALRETGWDAVVIRGAAQQPVQLHVTAEGAEIRPAAHLWGTDTATTEAESLSQLPKRSSALCIGVAGENLVRVASVMHENAHTLGRGGLGAVFGSKKLKVFTVTSSGPLKAETEPRFVEMRRHVASQAMEAPATRNYHLYGTPVMVALVNEAGAFPTDFFTKGAAPHRATLEVERWHEWCTVENLTCPPCLLQCRKVLTITEGPEAGRHIHGPEYETLFAFGGSCMVEHALDVAKLNERCNLLGLDTMSTANLVGAAIKATELGRLSDGPKAVDVGAISSLLDEIATRSTSTGEALAQGMEPALGAFGMAAWSTTSKGLDPAGYEPRRLKGMALSYALSPRGACHLRATFYKPELGGLLNGLDDDTFVQTYIDWEDRMLLMDSFTMCRFYRDLLTWDFMTAAATQLNGAPVTKPELERLCTQTLTRIRRFNFSLGLSPADDTVAERFFTQATDKAPALDREELERRVRFYWVKRGWGSEGYPPGPVDSAMALSAAP